GQNGPSKLSVWDPIARRQVCVLRDKAPDAFEYVRFSADGRTLGVKLDNAVLLLDAATGKELRRFPGGYGFALSPDGSQLAVGDDETAVQKGREPLLRLWDVASGKVCYHLGEHTEELDPFRFSPDGR